MSGAGAPAPTRAKPPASARFEANGPVCVASNSSSAAGSSASSRLSGSGVVHTSCVAGVVGEVLADRRLVEQHLDFAHRQVLGRADAGEHQQLRRVVGAAAEDHLALGAQLLRPGRAGVASTPTARVPSNRTRWTCM